MLHGGPARSRHLGLARWWDQLVGQHHGIFLQNTGGLALSVAHNHPTGWIGGGRLDPGQLKGQAIGHGNMATGAG